MARTETAVKPKKKGGLIRKGVVVLAGLLVGCGGAVGIQYSVGAMVPAAIAKERSNQPEPMEYVELGKVMVPVVDGEGDLVSYVKIDASFEVPEGTGEEVKTKIPAVLHEINMVTWRSALSKGADGKLVDTKLIEKIFSTAAKQVYGKDVDVRRVLLTSTVPA